VYLKIFTVVLTIWIVLPFWVKLTKGGGGGKLAKLLTDSTVGFAFIYFS
jgi:hypothetical protein